MMTMHQSFWQSYGSEIIILLVGIALISLWAAIRRWRDK